VAKKSAVVPLHLAVPGAVVDAFALLIEKTPQTTRDGKRFVLCRFRDAKRTVSTAVWSDSVLYRECETEWMVGVAYKLRGSFVQDERYGPKLDLLQIRPIREGDAEDGYREGDLMQRSRFESATMLAQLKELAGTIADEPLRKLTLELLETHGDALANLPATANRFYPFPGGWLEHILNVARHCLLLADAYRLHYPDLTPALNRDALLAAALLHDLGRVLELVPSLVGAAPEVTVDGRLYGHVLLARDLIRAAAATIPELAVDMLRLLEHIVLSHLTLPEWGSPRLPMVPEALILHHADDLDAKMEMYARCLQNDLSPGDFTERDPVLNKPLWKGRTV